MMRMVLFVIAGLLWALMRGLSLRSLLELRFHWPWLLIGAFGTQLLLWGGAVAFHASVPPWCFIMSLLAVVVALWRNAAIPGVWMLALGASLNWFAVTMHGGTMPVSVQAWEVAGHSLSQLQDSRHSLVQPGGVTLLGDWIPMWRYVLSPGDIVAGIGVVWLIRRNARLRGVR